MVFGATLASITTYMQRLRFDASLSTDCVSTAKRQPHKEAAAVIFPIEFGGAYGQFGLHSTGSDSTPQTPTVWYS